VAEDQVINMQVLKSQIAEHGLVEQCEFCFNGEEAFLKAKEIIIDSVYNPSTDQQES
jgi:hypothetical protein